MYMYRIYKDYILVYGHITPIMENQMESTKENKMKIGGICRKVSNQKW